MNTTDASLGNVISGNQLRALPLEGRSVVGLLSLQAGAVYVPTNTLGDQDNRSGAVSGARADQSNVTLDGVDNNDPVFNTAYTGALRSTLDSLQEFRVTTSNYNADSGRSSSAQVSLVTKSGANQFHGSGYDVLRRTSTSSNEYFNKLAGNDVPLLDKNIYGGSFGGALIKDKLFFFGNYERLKEDSEALAERGVPSLSMRDGVMVYQCADPAQCPGGTVQGFANSHTIEPGYYGATPGELAGLDPLGIGPSVLASDYFNQLPAPNDAGLDGYNIMAYKFTAPFSNTFNTTIGRVDYRPGGNHSFFGRFNVQRDTELDVPQYPDRDLPPNTSTETKSWGTALGWDSVLTPTLINTFRYGYTKMVLDRIGTQTGPLVYFRFIDDLNEGFSSNGRRTPAHNFVNDTTWVKGRHTVKFGTNLRFTRIPSYTDANSYSYGSVNPSWVNGVGREIHARSDELRPARVFGASRCRRRLELRLIRGSSMLGVVSAGHRPVQLRPRGQPAAGRRTRHAAIRDERVRVLRAGQLAAGRQADDQRRSPLQPRLATLGNERITGGAQCEPRGAFRATSGDDAEGHPGEHAARHPVRARWPGERQKGLLRLGQEQLRAQDLGGVDAHEQARLLRGGYSLVYDRIGLALAQNFDNLGSFGLSTALDE